MVGWRGGGYRHRGCAAAQVAAPPAALLMVASHVTLRMPASLCMQQATMPVGLPSPPPCSGVLSIYIEKAEGLSARMHDAGFTRNM